MQRFITVFLFILCVSLSSFVQARWANPEDASVSILSVKQTILVKHSGVTEEKIELKVKILKDSARSFWSNYPLIYNASSSKVKILKAETCFQGKSYPVKPEFLEDKPLASAPEGFDQMHQILIAYPQAEIGAVLTLQYLKEITQPVFENFYTEEFVFGDGLYVAKQEIQLQSEIPLHVAIQDPKNHLKVSENTVQNIQHIHITLKRPIYIKTIDEPGVLSFKHYPWVSVSSVKTWAALSRKMSPHYEAILKQPLPALFQTILESAQKLSNQTDQINFVTAELAEKVKYMGDWSSVKGQYIPHNLSEIARKQFGDCKDYSVATAAILNRLGLKAQVLCVLRGIQAQPSPNTLPTLNHFNHAMLKVVGEKNRIYWVDPTNLASMAEGIFPDIADRKALVIDSKQPALVQIPPTNPAHMQSQVKQAWDLANPTLLKVEGEVVLKGESALQLTGLELNLSKTAIGELLINSFSDPYLLEDKTIELPDLSSRIVKDLSIPFHYKQRSQNILTTMGPAIQIPTDSWIRALIETKTGQVRDLFIGPMSSKQAKFVLKNFKPLGQAPEDIVIQTPWFKATRTVRLHENEAIISSSFTILKNKITSDELNSRDYQQMKETLKDKFKLLILYKHIN